MPQMIPHSLIPFAMCTRETFKFFLLCFIPSSHAAFSRSFFFSPSFHNFISYTITISLLPHLLYSSICNPPPTSFHTSFSPLPSFHHCSPSLIPPLHHTQAYSLLTPIFATFIPHSRTSSFHHSHMCFSFSTSYSHFLGSFPTHA